MILCHFLKIIHIWPCCNFLVLGEINAQKGFFLKVHLSKNYLFDVIPIKIKLCEKNRAPYIDIFFIIVYITVNLFILFQELVTEFLWPCSWAQLQMRRGNAATAGSGMPTALCATPGSVAAACDLLAALCHSCVPNMALLATLLTDCFYSGEIHAYTLLLSPVLLGSGTCKRPCPGTLEF